MEKDGQHLAKELRVVRSGPSAAQLYIDGELFPLFTRDGFHIEVRRNQISGVTLTIAAERVYVEDEMMTDRNVPPPQPAGPVDV